LTTTSGWAEGTAKAKFKGKANAKAKVRHIKCLPDNMYRKHYSCANTGPDTISNVIADSAKRKRWPPNNNNAVHGDSGGRTKEEDSWFSKP
jgi:hypothetical protein